MSHAVAALEERNSSQISLFGNQPVQQEIKLEKYPSWTLTEKLEKEIEEQVDRFIAEKDKSLNQLKRA